MGEPTPQQTHDINLPHISIHESGGVIGLGLDDRTIIQLRTPGPHDTDNTPIPEEDLMRVDGTLPKELITNTPHIETPEKSTTDGNTRHYIPLPSAPDWYHDRLENEFESEDWVVYANRYNRCSDAEEMEAVVMALTETIDTIGPGQSTVISDTTGWPEDLVHDILTDLQLPKQDRYHRQTHESITTLNDDRNNTNQDDKENADTTTEVEDRDDTNTNNRDGEQSE